MAVRDIFKVSVKTFFNPAGWINLDALLLQTTMIWGMVRGLFTAPQAVEKETFEGATQRLGLTEKDIEQGASTYRFYATIFLILGILLFFYAFYLLFAYGTFIGWLLGIASAGLLLSYAFRYDFWAFQMKRRQLGATFAEWKRARLGG